MSSWSSRSDALPDKDAFLSDEATSMFFHTSPSCPASFGHIRNGVDGHIS